jgi:hypothetical protein
MSIALKLSLKKLPLMPKQLLLWVQIHRVHMLEAMMLFQQAKKHAQAAQDRAKAAQDQVKATKKVALEAEKDNDATQKELQELQRVMEPKRPRTNAITANDLEECAGHCRALLYAKVQLLV